MEIKVFAANEEKNGIFLWVPTFWKSRKNEIVQNYERAVAPGEKAILVSAGKAGTVVAPRDKIKQRADPINQIDSGPKFKSCW